MYPGTYEEFHWGQLHPDDPAPLHDTRAKGPAPPKPAAPTDGGRAKTEAPAKAKEDRKAEWTARREDEIQARRRKREESARRRRIEDLENRIAEREQTVRDLEATMAAPGFYEDREAARPIIDRHQALMWEVGDLMGQWEALQAVEEDSSAT